MKINSSLIDRISTGLILGLVLPVLIYFIVFLVTSGDMGLKDYFNKIISRDVVTHFISLCVFPNVFLFLLFNRFDKLRSAKGVLGITFIWALVVFLIKLL